MSIFAQYFIPDQKIVSVVIFHNRGNNIGVMFDLNLSKYKNG